MSNNGGVYTWSKTPGSNAGADNTVNWTEGQAPSSVNDSARAMMTSVAKYRDDISGAIVTTGISVAYIVASNQNFDTLADFNGQMICFTPHVTNGAGPVTMTVDGFANLPLRTSPGKELLAGTIIQGTPYAAVYNNTDGSLYLQGFYGNPYLIPLAGGLPFFGPTAPNSSFAFPFGQAISRTTYSALFSLLSTTYGAGDGTNTFNIPDLRGRVVAGKDDMGGTAASRLTNAGSGVVGTTLGAVGGAQSEPIAQTNLPSVNFAVAGTVNIFASGVAAQGVIKGSPQTSDSNSTTAFSVFEANKFADLTATLNGPGGVGQAQAASGGGNVPLPTVQPTIVCNYIIRVT
jgi:microcystin-dependent protein